MDNKLLALLKRIEWHLFIHHGYHETSCPSCNYEKEEGHLSGCELKAHIDRLEAEQTSARNEGHAQNDNM